MSRDLERFELSWSRYGELGKHVERYPDRATCEDRVRYLKREFQDTFSDKLIWNIRDTACTDYWTLRVKNGKGHR